MTFGPEKVQERLTRNPPPGRLLQHTPRRQPLVHFSQQRYCPFVLMMEFHGMRKALHRHQTWRKKKGKNVVNPSSVTLNPVALRELFNAEFHLCNPSLTLSPHCVLSFLVVLLWTPPKKLALKDIQQMLLVNDTFTSECFLSLSKLFWIVCYACAPFQHIFLNKAKKGNDENQGQWMV